MSSARACISTEARNSAIWITLDRPEVLNSINLRLVEELVCVLKAIEQDADPAIRALVITGAGRAFCAGGDLREMFNGDSPVQSGAGLFSAISRALERLEACRLPVIAAVNGIATAGGLEIVLACDLVIAAEHATFGDGHANFGLLPGGGGSVRLPRKIGINRAKYMMLSGKTFPASVLAEWGLVCDIVDGEQLQHRVDALVAELGQKSPLGIARMKQLVDLGMQQSMVGALAAEQSLCALHDFSFDRNEGLDAFRAKRPPRFEGR
jgi:enoyl-CoA hydratase/carnithine racemase